MMTDKEFNFTEFVKHQPTMYHVVNIGKYQFYIVSNILEAWNHLPDMHLEGLKRSFFSLQ